MVNANRGSKTSTTKVWTSALLIIGWSSGIVSTATFCAPYRQLPKDGGKITARQCSSCGTRETTLETSTVENTAAAAGGAVHAKSICAFLMSACAAFAVALVPHDAAEAKWPKTVDVPVQKEQVQVSINKEAEQKDASYRDAAVSWFEAPQKNSSETKDFVAGFLQKVFPILGVGLVGAYGTGYVKFERFFEKQQKVQARSGL